MLLLLSKVALHVTDLKLYTGYIVTCNCPTAIARISYFINKEDVENGLICQQLKVKLIRFIKWVFFTCALFSSNCNSSSVKDI